MARQRSNCYLTLLVQRTIPPQSHLYSNRYHHPRIARTGRAVLDRTGIDYYLSKSGKPTVMGRNLYAAFPHETSVAVTIHGFPHKIEKFRINGRFDDKTARRYFPHSCKEILRGLGSDKDQGNRRALFDLPGGLDPDMRPGKPDIHQDEIGFRGVSLRSWLFSVQGSSSSWSSSHSHIILVCKDFRLSYNVYPSGLSDLP